jgi:hypothetical protein
MIAPDEWFDDPLANEVAQEDSRHCGDEEQDQTHDKPTSPHGALTRTSELAAGQATADWLSPEQSDVPGQGAFFRCSKLRRSTQARGHIQIRPAALYYSRLDRATAPELPHHSPRKVPSARAADEDRFGDGYPPHTIGPEPAAQSIGDRVCLTEVRLATRGSQGPCTLPTDRTSTTLQADPDLKGTPF